MPNHIIDPSQVMHENIEGEVIVINIDTGNYHSLRFVTADIWMMVDAKYNTESMIDALTQLYPDDETAIKQDIPELLNLLVQENLIQISGGSTETTTITISKQEAGYTTPALETYSDLQGLLLVDPIHDVAEDGWPNVAE
jgi:hypothetical protein